MGYTKKPRRIKRKTPPIEDVLRGSLVLVKRVCGKSPCRCQRGSKHRSLYISQYHKGGTRMTYVPKNAEKSVRRYVQNYRAIKSLIDRATKRNMRCLLTGRKRM